MNNKYSGIEKAQMREATSPNRCLSHILDLCSAQVGSTKFFVENGVADKNTKFTIIEQEKASIPKIHSNFKKLNVPRPEIFNGKVRDCPFVGPFELVNLDTCSTPSEPILNWISRLTILPGGELNLWVTAFRNSGMWRQTLVDAFVYNHGDGGIVVNQLEEKIAFPRNITVEQKCVYAALAASLSFYDFDIVVPSVRNRPPGQYRDNRNTMYVYRLVNIKLKKKPLRPSLAQILGKIRPTKYESNDRKESSRCAKIEMNPSEQIVNAIKTGKLGEATRTINKILSDAQYLHHSSKMVKAGFKAQITKIEPNPAVVKAAHNYIDRF